MTPEELRDEAYWIRRMSKCEGFPTFLRREFPEEFVNKSRSWGKFFMTIGEDAAEAIYARFVIEKEE
jgi:hypothetical protein